MKHLYLFLFSGLLLITACNYVQKIKDGSMAYERKQYDVAIEMLKKEYAKEKSRVEQGKLAYLLGESYTRTNNSINAIEWYKIAYDNSYGIDALKAYAYALKQNEKYKEAQIAFKELGIEIGSPYEYRREIAACKTAQGWKDSGEESLYSIKNSSWNSSSSDYAPTLYTDNQLVITSDRAASTGDEKYKWTGNDFSDLFIVNTDNNSVTPFPGPINTVHNEGTVSFNGDFTEMIFSRCFVDGKRADSYCQLMMSEREGDQWSEPSPLPFTKDEVIYAHPTLTKDGNRLYFSCNDPEGWGLFDIWVVDRTIDGWGEPRLLSRSINTPGNEKFPFIDADTLYFASDNHTSMGGLDIFRTYLLDESNWTPAFNLKTPINSGSDDFGYIIDYDAQLQAEVIEAGYFTSTRFDGKGMDDIYRYEKTLPPPPPPIDTTAPPIEYKIVLEGYILEKVYEDINNPNSRVLGRKPLSGAKVAIKVNDETENITVGDDGLFVIELDANSNYFFFASRENYLSNDERFSTYGMAQDPENPIQKYEIEIVLDKIFKNQEIVLENIYYDLDKWNIREDAKPTLNALVRILEQNPQISIQLASHTDCRGNGPYNQNLSQKRAQSAVNYLIEYGINTNRLTAVGYGESTPVNTCNCQTCTEVEHQENRRTTFSIVDL